MRSFLSGVASSTTSTRESTPAKGEKSSRRKKRGADKDIVNPALLLEENDTPRRTRGARKSYIEALPDAADDEEFESQLHARQEREAMEEQQRALEKATTKARSASAFSLGSRSAPCTDSRVLHA